MEHVKRWFRKWNLDLTKEEVISAINLTKNDPSKYTPSPFDGPYAPEDSADFNGKTIVFKGEGREYIFRVEDTNTTWFSNDGSKEEKCFCQIRTMEGELYFLNLTVPSYETARQVSLIADTVSGAATVVDAHVGTANCTRDVDREFIFGRLEGDYAGGPLHAYTSELAGKAIIWDYGAGFTQVKHIYNSNLFYTYSMDTADGPWMATNPADYIKVRDHFYIFSFVEERQPGLQMLLLINLDTLHD
ncbi:MAG: MoaF N-terminal domain-containing protein, partial [Lachnospiraceae bacterium]|nr:MoaF N-terminal domain-containing protein [Lachnospiraceae bacterium]